MNKKLFLGMFAAAGMLLATSCSNDELDVVQSGNEAQVTFSLGLEGGIASRAISDGTGAKKLVCAVYNANNEVIKTVSINNTAVNTTTGQFVNTSAFQGGLTDQINVTLAKGQTYTMVFWAQNGTCDAYDTDDLKAVKVDYTNGAEGTAATGDLNNDETRDAFYAAETFKVEGDKEINVTLKRPFAQINVGVTAEDWEAAVASGITIQNSSVVIKNVADEINLLTGAVTASEAMAEGITYALNAIPNDPAILKADANEDGIDEEYQWLSMSYILVNDTDNEADENGLLGTDQAVLEGLKFTFEPKSGQSIAFEEGLAGAPVRRNWRTNILGKILTGDVQFNITIDPAYDDDYIYPSKAEEELEFAATFGGKVTLSEDVTLTTPLAVTADMILDLNGHTITNKVENAKTDVIVVEEGATLTINGDGKVEAVSGNDGYAIIAEGKVIINGGTYRSGLDETQDGNCTVYARGKGEVYIYGGDFSTPDGDDTTLIINKKDADRNTTTIEIYGGTFKNFDPANNAAEGANTNFVAEGYKSLESGDNYVVVANEVDAIATTADVLATALTADEENIKVILANDIDLPITSLGTQTGGSGEYKLGGENTKSIVIDLNGKKLNITTTYWSNLGAKNENALFTIKNGTMTSSQATGTWNSYDLTFSNCNYAIENVVFEKAVAFANAGKSVVLKNITINETHDYYAMWITAEGQNITIDGLTINSDGRGIKIDEEYVGTPAKVTLNINNVTFKTEKKAAVLVKSAAGATINASNLNISEVTADQYFAVWVDEDAAAHADKVIVNGAMKAVEGKIANVNSSTELAAATIENNSVIFLGAGDYIVPASAKGKNVTFIGTGNPEDVKVAVTKVGTGGENCDYGLDGSTVTFEGITITTNSSTYIGYARCNGTYKNCIINGTYTLYGNSTFENCTFNVSGDVYNIWTWGAPTATFTGCTFNSDGKAMLLYGTENTKLTINNCTFNDKGGLTDLKAAVEIGNDYDKSYELIVNNTTVNGYAINDKGIVTNTTLWANKNSMSKEKLNVVVDGVDVY